MNYLLVNMYKNSKQNFLTGFLVYKINCTYKERQATESKCSMLRCLVDLAYCILVQRGIVVEWLERLGYGAESCCKV